MGGSHDTRCGITLLQFNTESQLCVCSAFHLASPDVLAVRTAYVDVSFITEKSYSSARQHFLHSDRVEDFGVMLLEYAMKEGYPHERELFLAQAVLQ